MAPDSVRKLAVAVMVGPAAADVRSLQVTRQGLKYAIGRKKIRDLRAAVKGVQPRL